MAGKKSAVPFNQIIKGVKTKKQLEAQCPHKFVLFLHSGKSLKEFKALFACSEAESKTEPLFRFVTKGSRPKFFGGNN